MSWKVGNRRLVETGPSIYVDGVGDFVRAFAAVWTRMRGLVLSCWSEEEAAVWSERQATEEGGKCLIHVEIGVTDAQTNASRHAW